MIKAVIFDLDGVLVTTDELHFAAWKHLAEELGISGFTKTDNARQRGVSRMASLEVVLEKTDRKFSDEEKLTLAEKKNDMYVKSLESLDKSAVLDGVFDFIAYLRISGIKTAVGHAKIKARPGGVSDSGAKDRHSAGGMCGYRGLRRRNRSRKSRRNVCCCSW